MKSEGNSNELGFTRPRLGDPVNQKYKDSTLPQAACQGPVSCETVNPLAGCQGPVSCETVNRTEWSSAQIENEIIPKIEQLDLESVQFKLMNPSSGKGMSLEQAVASEKWYKRFLILSVTNTVSSIVPHKVIDQFWHAHILDTYKYHEDCHNVFGFYLHHFPFFGIRSDADFDEFEATGKRVEDLYLDVFGESIDLLTDLFKEEASS